MLRREFFKGMAALALAMNLPLAVYTLPKQEEIKIAWKATCKYGVYEVDTKYLII